MSKHIETIPLTRVERIAVVQGGGRSLAQVKSASGCDYCMNGGFYDMGTGKPTNHLKSGGTVLAKEAWGCWGFAWDTGADIRMEALPAGARRDYIGAFELLSPMVGPGDKLQYGGELGGKRGRTAIALTGNELILYCSGDGTADGRTPEALRDELYRLGAETAIMLDGGGSSQCDFGEAQSAREQGTKAGVEAEAQGGAAGPGWVSPQSEDLGPVAEGAERDGGGRVIASSRRVNNYICVWLEEDAGGQRPPLQEGKPMSKTVCLDPGHGPGCVNGAPDGTYKEHEFAWDMSRRVKGHLERCGVRVVLTRGEAGYPSLTERAGVSNKAGADLLVSLHSNADGGNGWGNTKGFLVYTSTAGDSAGRNVAARSILERAREAGVGVRGTGLLHELYTVLVKASAPAVLIEYGFHTNKEDVKLLLDGAYRDKLAEATAKGVCDYLGVEWTEDGGASGMPRPTEPEAWYAAAQKFVVDHGVSDGTRPTDGVTRAECWEMLRKYDEAVKAGK